jgi:ABC-2 type transport system ATP-binding protein
MIPALSLRGIRKSFGTTTAVENVDLVVPQGGLYGVIGPNGAGKTTCIRMVMGILFPDAGELSVLGRRSALDAKDRIGYLPEERGVYRKMRVGAFLTYMARLKGLAAAEAASRAGPLLARVGLEGVHQKRCEELSKGMLQRVQFAATVIHQPDLLILDEPFSGLDPVSVKVLREYVLAEHRRGATILLSTHVMAHAEDICQHVVMLHQGHKVLDEPVAQLRRQFDPRILLFEPRDPEANVAAIAAVRGVEGIDRAETGHAHYRVRLAAGTDPASCIPPIAAAVPAARVELSRVRLEDLFIRIVSEGSQSRAAEARKALAEEPAETMG